MKLPARPRRSHADDVMLPLINIVFLLMVSFMLVGALSPPDPIELEPARSSTLEPSDAGTQALVVAADGRLGLAGSVFGRDELAARAQAWRARNEGAVLQVKADAAADTQRVLEVLEVLRDAGIPRVELLAAKADLVSQAR